MTTITEDRQHLTLDPSWTVLKWDEAAEFKGSLEAALHNLVGGGTKAADVVATRVETGVRPLILVAEFKDFNHPDVPRNGQARVAAQATSDDVLRDVIRKVIDTLSGATFAHDQSGKRCSELTPWREATADPQILVLYCVELPKTQALAHLAWTKALQQRLRWLGPRARVIVTSSDTPFVGLGLAYSL